MLTDTLVFLSTGAEAEGSEIPSAVPVEDVAPGTQEAAIEAPELMEVAAEEAAAVDVKSAPHAKHTASRKKLASHAKRSQDVPVNFP
jgi:hypothetical protein